MSQLRVIHGDLFPAVQTYGNLHGVVVIPHVVNDVGAWGAGFVLPLADAYPLARERYLRRWRTKGDRYAVNQNLGDADVFSVAAGVFVANMCAQHDVRTGSDGRPPIRYGALAKAMAQVVDKMLALQPAEFVIACPRFGCGLAGGEARVIFALIQELWVDQGIDVYVHQV